MKSDVQLRQQVNRLQLELHNLTTQLGANQAGQLQPPNLSSPFSSLTPIIPIQPAAANNLVRNGEFSHSVDTWNNPPPGSPTADVGKEAAFWWSNNPPFVGQILDFTTSLTSSVNQTLKAFVDAAGVHTTYNPQFCDWDRPAGEARLQGDKTMDALLPHNRVIIPNRAVAYFGALIALRDSTIRVPEALRIFAGIWDNTLGDWVKAAFPFTVDHAVRGTPSGTTQRNYRILAYTDRGYSYLSEEEIVTNAPSDAGFSTADVLLTWQSIAGILQYKVYRHDITAGKYRLLSEIGSGATTYVDNGSILNDDVGGYPPGTTNTPQAYVATQSQDLQNLPVDGSPWVPLFLNIPIPTDYDTQTTTADQVLRIGMTIPLDQEISDARINNGSTNLQSDSANFTTLDVGRSIVVTDSSGNELSTTISAFVNDENVTLGASWTFASAVDATASITAGGDHGILIDAIHLSYVSGSAFGPNPDDTNRLQNGGQNPITAPRSSTQGGAGGGGSTGGGEGGVIDAEFGCVTLDCPVNVLVGNAIETLTWKAIHIGEVIFSGDLRPNWVLRKPKARTLNLHLVRVKASWWYDIELPCSPGHRIITDHLDTQGRSVESLRVGDRVLISVDGHVQRKPIKEIINTQTAAEVGSFWLAQGHIYSAGRVYFRSWVYRLIARFFKPPVVGVLSHNLKTLETV